MTLTQATPKDLKALQQICSSAYTQIFANHWNNDGLSHYLEEQFGESRLSRELADKNYEYYFITHESETIGFIKLNLKDNTELSALPNGELEKIYILPRYSGQGLGQQAMREIIHRMQEKGKQLLHLCVLETNYSSIAFYKTLGFKFHSKTRLEARDFKEELRGMDHMVLDLDR